MIGYGSWNQPPGTWSDDSSLAFCLAESLTKGYNLEDIAANFVRWKQASFWSAHNEVFDIGNATYAAISRLSRGVKPILAGGMTEGDNGNGSLMRILPLLFYIRDMSIEDRYEKVLEVSSLTHAHFRSVFACFIYLEFALEILRGKQKEEVYTVVQENVTAFVEMQGFSTKEIQLFNRILNQRIYEEPEINIHSGGYVLQTLEASLWCLFNSTNYKEAVLKAVNLGGDTDTTACVTGGLAGLLYGYDNIPQPWLKELARKNDIDDLCLRLANRNE
jgi:ADP-ribosylglycohydrolase